MPIALPDQHVPRITRRFESQARELNIARREERLAVRESCERVEPLNTAEQLSSWRIDWSVWTAERRVRALLPALLVVTELKRSSFKAAKWVGLTNVLANSVWRRDRLLVLCYHGVSLADEHEWNPELYISSQALARRFDILARTDCTVLPLDQAVRRLYAGTLPHRAVALTFDDAFYDFKIRAFPLLQAYGYPATVYVTTQRRRAHQPIAHLLSSYLLWKHGDATLDARGIEGLNRVYTLTSAAERAQLVADMFARMRGERMEPDDEDAFARDVMGRLGIDYDGATTSNLLRIMTRADLAEMSRSGVAMELHTHRHRSPEDPDEFLEEVRLNRSEIEKITGRRPRHFCYPNGVYRAIYLRHLEAEGIESATTCNPELASRASHRLLLPRFVDNELGTDMGFEAWITGVASWLPRRTRKANGVH
jgi:peptidoglycan/xylan/chitin deacetylase (PgdA/CDA1 family)